MGQHHAPAALYPRERPGTHCTGGWVGPRAGLDYSEGTEFKCRRADWLSSLTFFWSHLQIPGYTSNYDRFLPNCCQYYSLITVRNFERVLTN